MNGDIPPNAVIGGETCTGEKIYIGRAKHDSELVLGKIQPSQKCLCYIYNEIEFSTRKYEILVYNNFSEGRWILVDSKEVTRLLFKALQFHCGFSIIPFRSSLNQHWSTCQMTKVILYMLEGMK